MNLSPKFDQALHYAVLIHAFQKRKDTEIPYLAHLLGVASIALEHGANEDEAIGALLHNARAILRDLRRLGNALWTRFTGGKEGTLWYYRALVTAFRQAGSNELIEELDRVVSEIELLADTEKNHA